MAIKVNIFTKGAGKKGCLAQRGNNAGWKRSLSAVGKQCRVGKRQPGGCWEVACFEGTPKGYTQLPSLVSPAPSKPSFGCGQLEAVTTSLNLSRIPKSDCL